MLGAPAYPPCGSGQRGFPGGAVFTGLNNIHPTVPGYGLPAKALLEAMGKTGDLIDFDQAYKNDSLLYSRSVGWSVSQLELSLLGTFGVFSGGSGFTS